MQSNTTYEILGLKFTLIRNEEKVSSLANMPSITINCGSFKENQYYGLILSPTEDNDSLMSARILFDPAGVTRLAKDLGKWLESLGYVDPLGGTAGQDRLSKALRAAGWDFREELQAKANPQYVRNTLGKLNPSTSKLYGDMWINPELKVVMYRRVSRDISLSFYPIGRWTCDGEEGYVFVNCTVGSSHTSWFTTHLPEDLSQLEAEFAEEYARRWPKYPACTFKLFNTFERKKVYKELTNRV